LAYKKVKEEGLYIYGDKQNGGTSTLYLSKIPFEKIERALKEKKERFQMSVNVENKIESKFNPIGKIVLSSGIISMIGAVVGDLFSKKTKKEDKTDEK
jgi:hypothetical protein